MTVKSITFSFKRNSDQTVHLNNATLGNVKIEAPLAVGGITTIFSKMAEEARRDIGMHKRFTATLEFPPNTKRFTLQIKANKLQINIPLKEETALSLADSALLEELRTPATTPSRSYSITDHLANFFSGLLYILWRLACFKGETPERTPLTTPSFTKTFADAPHLLPQMGAVRGIRPLPNEGSTCFLNSIMHAVMNLSPRVQQKIIQGHENKIAREQREIASYNKSKSDENYLSLVASMKASQALIQALRQYSSSQPLSLYAIRGLIGLDSLQEGNQEDAYELLDKIFEPLDGMTNLDIYHLLAEEKQFAPYHPKSRQEEEVLATQLAGKKNPSPLPTEFSRQPNFTLRLPMPDKRIPLQTLLDQEFEMRRPSEQDEPGTYVDQGRIGWYGVSQKRQVIETVGTHPEHMVVQLKRFRNDRSKVDSAVELPSNNKLTLVINGERVSYDIQTLVLHRGKTLQSGHYLDYVKKEDGWYEANDSQISHIGSSLPVRAEKEIYMLFLKKTGN
jgi:hypothetical protein